MNDLAVNLRAVRSFITFTLVVKPNVLLYRGGAHSLHLKQVDINFESSHCEATVVRGYYNVFAQTTI